MLQNKDEGLHAEVGITKISVESPEVENGVEPTGALGDWGIVGVHFRDSPPHWLGGMKPLSTQLLF